MDLNITQAADYIDTSIDTLRRWEKIGKLVPKRVGNRNDRKYSVKDLDVFLKDTKKPIEYDDSLIKKLAKQYSSEAVTFLQELVRTPSVNGVNPEKEIADLVLYKAQQLELPSFLIWKNKDRPNVFVGNSFTEKKSFLFVAHLDTVEPGDNEKWTHKPFSGTIVGDRMYGRGVLDCKAGIALSIFTLRILYDLGLLGLAKFVAGSDEEAGAQSDFGLPYVIEKGLRADAAIYTYPGYETISLGNRGLIRLIISCHGEQVHTGLSAWSAKTQGKNSIDGLIKFANEIEKIPLSSVHKKFPGLISVQTITKIQGGIGESIVPDFATMLIDTRLLPNIDHDKYIANIKIIAEKLESKFGYKYTVNIKNNAPATLINEKEPIVQILKKLTFEVLGITPILKGRGPSNESGILNRKGIPTIGGYGISGKNVHGIDEYAELSDIPKILEIYVKAAIELHNSQCKR